MSVDKFGRNKKTSTPEQGISLSYLEKHFQRKTDITRKLADLENAVHKLEKRYIQYVEKVQRDQGKQYITIWAEENGSLAKDTYEYSFGDGMVGKWAGYTVLTPSKVLKMGISVSSRVDPVEVGVSLVVNGVKTKCSILKPLGKCTHVIDTPEIDLRPGDTITFMTDTTAKRITGAIISLLLEITL